MRRQAGFTLVEVVAMLAVAGMVMLSLNQGMQFGVRAWRTRAAIGAWPAQIEPLDRLLRRLIEQSLPADASAETGPITGDRHRFVVLTRLPSPQGGPPSEFEAVVLVDAGGRLVLRLLPRPNVRWTVPPAARSMVLAEGLDHMDVSYRQPAPGAGAWVNVWDKPEPPALVRLHLAFRAGDGRRWPDIVAAPLAGFPIAVIGGPRAG